MPIVIDVQMYENSINPASPHPNPPPNVSTDAIAARMKYLELSSADDSDLQFATYRDRAA